MLVVEQDTAHTESLGKLRSVDNISLGHCASSTFSRRENAAYDGTESECEMQKSTSETLEVLKTIYGESTMSKINVSISQKRFREGTEYVNDDQRQGAPVTSAEKTLAIYCRLIWSMIADELDMSKRDV